jgi:hypothetical protein
MASLTPWIKGALKVARIDAPMSIVSVAVLAIVCAALFRLLGGKAPADAWAQLAFVNLCLLVVLLTAPITWPMNMVWLATMAVPLLFGPRFEPGTWPARFETMAAIGFILLIVPDSLAPSVLFPHPGAPTPPAPWRPIGILLGLRYVVAMALFLPYLVVMVRRGSAAVPVTAPRY